MVHAVLRVGFEDTREFVGRLLQDESGWPPDPRAWLFRGHANARWPLLPTALRSNVLLEPDKRPLLRGVRRSYREQVLAEWRLLRRFFEHMDAARITIPEDSQVHRSEQGATWWDLYLRDVFAATQAWPVLDVRTLSAAAQHYGLPTRLLDWSKSPLVAAYFAARDVAQRVVSGRVRRGQLLCVWGISTYELGRLKKAGIEHTIEVVSAPTAVIPNLAVQHGVFTIDLQLQRGEERVRRRSLDGLVHGLSGELVGESTSPMLVQLTLPIQRAPELLRRLAGYGIDATAIHAGHLGAAMAVSERASWDVADVVGATSF